MSEQDPQLTSPEEEYVSPEQGLEILRRLVQAFQMADSVISSEQRGRIWVVHGVQGGQPPEIASMDTVEDLTALVSELRMQQNEDPENRHYVHIFHGQRWSIQKGRNWKIYDGKSLFPVEGGVVDPFLDVSGSLLERPDLDDIVPVPAAAEDAVPLPAEAASEVDVVGPHVVGLDQEEAEPGTDPVIE